MTAPRILRWPQFTQKLPVTGSTQLGSGGPVPEP